MGKNCRDGSNTLLLIGQQEYQTFGLVVMIESHDIFKIMDFILFPLQIIFFFTDYSFFYRLKFQIPDYSFPLNAVLFYTEVFLFSFYFLSVISVILHTHHYFSNRSISCKHRSFFYHAVFDMLQSEPLPTSSSIC